jgi:aryl-alcohol dehydrogenase-like predicted oxidoreductase
VNRIGYGATQLAGDNVFGPPRDYDEAVRVLRAAVESGVNHIDTAQYYGPGTVNELIREALHPYPSDLAIVSKVAARRDDAGAVFPYDDPDQLRKGIEENLVTLGLDRLAAVNLRLMDGSRPGERFDTQLAALVEARDDGLIGGIGLSNISREHLRRAVGRTEIVCVQNLFNLAEQRSLDLLQECTLQGIAFVPFCPLGWPRGIQNAILTSPVLVEMGARLGATPAQIALAWLLDSHRMSCSSPGPALVDIWPRTSDRRLFGSTTPHAQSWRVTSLSSPLDASDDGAQQPPSGGEEARTPHALTACLKAGDGDWKSVALLRGK